MNRTSNTNGQNTWTREMEYTKSMQKRGASMLRMASRVSEWKSIVDVGCGNQQLREVVENLYPGTKYTGIDQHDHRKDTLIADFNNNEYPSVSADLAIVSGVFEYILPDKIADFLDNVCGTAPLIAFSYWPTDYVSTLVYKSSKVSKLRPKVWVNQFKLRDIIDFFNKRGFQIEIMKRYSTSSQYMMVFKKTKLVDNG